MRPLVCGPGVTPDTRRQIPEPGTHVAVTVPLGGLGTGFRGVVVDLPPTGGHDVMVSLPRFGRTLGFMAHELRVTGHDPIGAELDRTDRFYRDHERIEATS